MNKDLRRGLLALSMVVALGVASCEKDELQALEKDIEQLENASANQHALTAAQEVELKRLQAELDALSSSLDTRLSGLNELLNDAISNALDIAEDIQGQIDALTATDFLYDAETGVLTITMADGSQYETGDIRGEDGEPGATGLNGSNGLNGLNGADGLDGIQGEQGEAGENGIDGIGSGLSAFDLWKAIDGNEDGTVQDFLDSLKGEKGDQGDQGIQGVQGDQGIQGIQGPQGDVGPAGVAGESISISVTQDAEGNTVLTVGDDEFTIPAGADGIQGLQGIQGVAGIQGIQGEPGDDGIAGNDSVISVDDSVEGQITITINGTDYVIKDGVDGLDGDDGVVITLQPGDSGIDVIVYSEWSGDDPGHTAQTAVTSTTAEGTPEDEFLTVTTVTTTSYPAYTYIQTRTGVVSITGIEDSPALTVDPADLTQTVSVDAKDNEVLSVSTLIPNPDYEVPAVTPIVGSNKLSVTVGDSFTLTKDLGTWFFKNNDEDYEEKDWGNTKTIVAKADHVGTIYFKATLDEVDSEIITITVAAKVVADLPDTYSLNEWVGADPGYDAQTSVATSVTTAGSDVEFVTLTTTTTIIEPAYSYDQTRTYNVIQQGHTLDAVPPVPTEPLTQTVPVAAGNGSVNAVDTQVANPAYEEVLGHVFGTDEVNVVTTDLGAYGGNYTVLASDTVTSLGTATESGNSIIGKSFNFVFAAAGTYYVSYYDDLFHLVNDVSNPNFASIVVDANGNAVVTKI